MNPIIARLNRLLNPDYDAVLHTTNAVQAYCAQNSLPFALIASPDRTRTVSDLRLLLVQQLILSGWGYNDIGRLLHRHHATIMYLVLDTFPARYKYDEAFHDAFDRLPRLRIAPPPRLRPYTIPGFIYNTQPAACPKLRAIQRYLNRTGLAPTLADLPYPGRIMLIKQLRLAGWHNSHIAHILGLNSRGTISYYITHTFPAMYRDPDFRRAYNALPPIKIAPPKKKTAK